jgi:hypothetical protein
MMLKKMFSEPGRNHYVEETLRVHFFECFD